MIRGIERRKIFRDDDDREDLIERLSDLLPETRTQRPGDFLSTIREMLATMDAASEYFPAY